MMKNKCLTVMLASMISLSLMSCGKAPVIKNSPSAPEQASKENKTRTITDLGGNQVELSAASELKNIVILSPPVMSFAVNVIPDTNSIVGINSRSFTTANAEVLDKIFPNWQSADTSFVDSSFAINKESLLALDPDLVFYYGNFQKKGLDHMDIPCVDFFSKELHDPEEVSIAWDQLLRQIWGLDPDKGLQEEWNTTNEKLEKLLEDKKETRRALCIFSNTAGSIVVSGTDSFDSYAQSYFEKAGIQNVASEIEGTSQVSMEKIYEWNPDMIFIFQDAPAQAILDNSIEGQDWSLVDAWKNKAVYDIPRTGFSWITPCADSPLMPLWLVSKAYPDLLDDNTMESELKEYYKRNYSIGLTESDVDSILTLRN